MDHSGEIPEGSTALNTQSEAAVTDEIVSETLEKTKEKGYFVGVDGIDILNFYIIILPL